ncbi:hypothetical protein AXG55_08090 [Silvanigrella aquatica]|uniref:Uncharacterized protein n=1 Tax=Silvanigrella aquatica TaxID=1915309 RepID=A0A1L4D104_9BACT|nr:hypothetical protein AXG55_08090 [Silvanigrella aquatica]
MAKGTRKKSSYVILAIIFSILTFSISWFIQIYTILSNGNLLQILIALLFVVWLPVLMALLFSISFKLPIEFFILRPVVNKKIIWAILLPCLIAALGVKGSLVLSQISWIDPNMPLFFDGDSIQGILHLSLAHLFPIIIFCIVISMGTELIYRAFFIELCLKAGIKVPFIFSAILQFISCLPFLWYGYFGGGKGNILHLISWFFLFVFLSIFYYWLSLSPNERSRNSHHNLAKRSLLHPIIAASVFQVIYFALAPRYISENGNLWMSGPANVITIMIYFIITICLLMTKRLKY